VELQDSLLRKPFTASDFPLPWTLKLVAWPSKNFLCRLILGCSFSVHSLTSRFFPLCSLCKRTNREGRTGYYPRLYSKISSKDSALSTSDIH
jgi:hypothetical protein